MNLEIQIEIQRWGKITKIRTKAEGITGLALHQTLAVKDSSNAH